MSDKPEPAQSQVDDDFTGESDRTVCFCHNVNLSVLVKAIRAGATTIHDIQSETCASTGCGGCEYEVLEILACELERAAKR